MRSFNRISSWAQDWIGCFADDRFAELSIWRGTRMLHRLIVTPRWYRFPFMDQDDLQIGNVWTSSEARGQGLARAAILEAHRMIGPGAPTFWYVVDASNGSSVALIEACGYRLAGSGKRTRPLGIAVLGQFRLENSV